MVVTHAGKVARESAACVMPIPRATESPTIEELRKFISWRIISLIPVMAMEAKTEIVAPPRTHCGIVVKRAENFGTNPAIIRITAASPRTQRLITFVVVTIPTF